MLEPPKAVAVTVTGPVAPGLQVVNAASQCPAQATPLGARFRIEVSLDVKVMVVARLVPDVVWTLAVKARVPPTINEAVDEGVRVIFPANSGGPGCEPPPQPDMGKKSKKKRTAAARRRPSERNLPMHSSLFIIYESQVFESHRDAKNPNMIGKPVV